MNPGRISAMAAHLIQKPKSSSRSRDGDYWKAIVSRDRNYDGKFYYSVATTGVYCRPSCPARRAKRENVRFHDLARDAEAAGFRPCKRCKPTEPAIEAQYAKTIAEACRIIEAAEVHVPLDDLAARVGLSAFHFHRIFKSSMGVTPKAYAVAHRQKRVREGLIRSATVTEAIHHAGFASNGRFYASSSKVLGMTPTEFRSGGKDAVIRFAIGECSLGAILVAESNKGVCAVLLGDDPAALLKDLQDRFPKAELAGGDRSFEKRAAKIIAYTEHPGSKIDLPLDIRGTAFQYRVWQALRDIPAGSTVSYTDVANMIGRPKSVRAVAGACAANSIAVVVPCHRVVRSDGALSGYRWGIERKRQLLKRERGS